MKKERSLCGLRDWMFFRMIAPLVNGDWIIVIKNSPNSERSKEEGWRGLTDFEKKTIFIDDEEDGILSTLCHELCHVVFQDFLLEEARRSAKAEMRKMKGRGKAMKWAEKRVIEWEDFFFRSLTRRQRKLLRVFIDEAKKGS